MKAIPLIILILTSINTMGQTGITFEIEKLSKPEKLLYLTSYDDIYKNLILNDANLSRYEVNAGKIDLKYDILAKSQAPDSLVSFGYNPFFKGMHRAYAEHRPFVLSPDMIWLLISQGFARHVNANPEELRDRLVNFSGKLTLLVEPEHDLLNDPSGWEDVFPQFTSQIAEHTGEKLINILTSDFSTTTPVEKVASEITIMEAMEPYFEYVVMYIICGIPQITLQGTTEDWQRVLDKTRSLAEYDLKWWTSEMEPILKEFVSASRGDIDKKFWRNMFKVHSQKKYGAPDIIDGWIVKFFPYDKDGKRNSLNKLIGGESLPEEMVKVDVKYVEIDGGQPRETMLELWAGFVGLEQDPETFALTPEISWMIRKKDITQLAIQQKLESINKPIGRLFDRGIDLKIITVPENLKKLNEIFSLGFHFKGDVLIPGWLKDIRIGKLVIEGKITEVETEKIISWFPRTDLEINGKEYNKGNNGWIILPDNTIPEEVLKLKEIWVLEIWNKEYADNKLILPDALKSVKIDNLSLLNEPSPEVIEQVRKLLPETNIYIKGKKLTK